MGKRYQTWTQDQLYLFPPSMRDWLDEDHLVRFVLDVVSVLDISRLEAAIRSKDGRGQRPYDPRMMLSLLVYAYCTGVHSSRRIERACHESVPFRVISGNAQPHFTTINEFRRVHRVLRLCREAGLLRVAVRGCSSAVSGGGAAEAASCGCGRHEGEGEREQAQGDELQADGGRGEASASGSGSSAGAGGLGGHQGGRVARRWCSRRRVAGGTSSLGESSVAASRGEVSSGSSGPFVSCATAA